MWGLELTLGIVYTYNYMYLTYIPHRGKYFALLT